ncbi:hypothetical protein [Nostoc sp.]|uniref:hypothetical protein n=1 Tax=Nostoc sp. TaxID=1180 RepID=UPI002FFD448F
MDSKQERFDKAYIWANIDFDKVKHRINVVTCQIEWVIQKYQLSNPTGNSGKKNNQVICRAMFTMGYLVSHFLNRTSFTYHILAKSTISYSK